MNEAEMIAKKNCSHPSFRKFEKGEIVVCKYPKSEIDTMFDLDPDIPYKVVACLDGGLRLDLGHAIPIDLYCAKRFRKIGEIAGAPFRGTDQMAQRPEMAAA
jgi:hypothetical protein